MPRDDFTLYVCGSSGKTQQLVDIVNSNLASWCGKDPALTVIDILSEPEIAVRDEILVTPTLARRTDDRLLRVVGDLTNTDAVRRALSN